MSLDDTVLSTSSICNEIPNGTRNEQVESIFHQLDIFISFFVISLVEVDCPICAVKINAKKINKHLDMCSLKDERRSSLRKARKRKRFSR